MEFDGYRGADDVEEEVRNVGEGTDLFTHYAIGLPILLRIFSYLDVHSLRQVVLVNRAWYGHNKDRLTESHDVERSLHVCDYLSYVVQSHIKEIKLKDQAYIAAKKNKACPAGHQRPFSILCCARVPRVVHSRVVVCIYLFLALQQKNASLFTSDPLVEYNPTDNTIDYVNATIDLLRQYLKLQAVRQQQKKRMGLNDKEEQERRAFLTQLLKIMNTQLRDTILALSEILSGRTKWNSNFEIFELSIRRYYEQLRVLFPAKPSSPGPVSASPARKRASPTAIISDPQARLVWQMRVGSDKYSCEFERFYEMVIEREFLSVTSEKMKQDLYYYFNYFLNFPRDNMVTTYKWEVLTRLFGPYHEFIENFSNYVLGSGFLGLINRHHAEEILENHPEAVLMRFSRTYPTCLAFSFRKKDGKYDHYTNNPVWHGYPPFKGTRPKEETKSNIPIKEFLEKVFLQKGYELLPLRIDGKSVAAKGTASKYAQVADPYLDTDNFEAEEESSDRHRAPASHPISSASWGGYKNSAASPSSSFSERAGFGGGAYLADSDSSPSTARKGSPQGEESQSPWSSPLPQSFAPTSPSARRQAAVRQPQLDNYVEDSIMNDNSPASLLPPPSSFTSISPPSSPSRSTGYRDNQPSSSPSPSPYSDVFEYQRQSGPQQQRERGRSSGGSSGGGTRPVPVVQTTFHGPTTSQSPQESCFYLDGATVKEELERNDPSSSRTGARLGGTSPIKSKRAESFQENYLDDVVFVEEEDDRDDSAVRQSGRNPSPPIAVVATTTPAFREYAAGQRATADPRQRQTVTVAVTTTTGVSGVYIGGGEELATSAAQQDSFMMEALLKGGHAGSVAARDKAEREERERRDQELREQKERERREKRREERTRAMKEFEQNASAYERDGDIHFVDEDEAFRVSAPAKNDDAFEFAKPDKEYEEPERYAGAQPAPSLLLAKQKAADELVDDSILAAILGQQQQGDAYASSTVDQAREACEQQEREKREREERRREKEEKRREKEERRREKEERRKRKEERRAKKEEKRLKAQEEFAAAATSYGADSYGSGDASISSGYFAEDEILPVHSPRRSGTQQQNAQWDEYFLDEQKPGVKLGQASAPSQGEAWAAEAVDDEAMMAAILGESGAKQQPAKAKEQAPAAEVSPYDEPFDSSFEEAAKGKESESDSESEGEREREREQKREEAEQRKRRDEEEDERARQRQEEQEALATKKNEEKERKEREEQRAQLEEKKTAEARQKEGFVLPYAELTSTDRELLPRYVDRSKLESYLSDEEFKLVFGCPRDVFYSYKVWRQQQIKKNAGLF